MAPECLSRKYGRPAFASDVFSVGIIMWELWAKRRVYTGFRNLEENTVWDEETKQHRVDVKLVAKRMASERQRPELPADCPVLWSLLMQACWEAAIDARPTFAQMLAVLEAMAVGLPVIASDAGGIPEIITPNETGLLVDRVHLGRLGEGVLELLDRPEEAARIGAAARQSMLDRFLPSAEVSALRGLLADVAPSASS